MFISQQKWTYFIRMGPILMLGPIGSIAESFRTSREFTAVRFFPRMRSEMGLEVLQPGVGFGAVLKGAAMGLFTCMPPHMHHQHVLSFEGFFFS